MDQHETPPLDRAVSELVRLADKSVAPTPADQLTRRWAKLRLKLARAKEPRRGVLVPALAAAIVVAILVGGFRYVRNRPVKLSYDVDGGSVIAGGFVKANADEAAPTLRFSDGTNVALRSRSKVRLLSTDADGPKVALDDGEARVRVFHREGTRWLFDAGPFTIVVKGTSFVVRWSESDKWLRLYLKSGSVAVSGPLPSGELLVREGQELSVRLRQGEIVLRDDEDARALDWDRRTDPQHTAADPVPPPAGVREPEPAREARSPAAARRREERNWSDKLAKGKVKQILEEAQALGDAAIEEATSEDLDALGDAARYSSKEDLARRAFLAQRRRFPNGARAAKDAYFLGRLDEAAGRPAKALEWFDLYLHEAPTGTFASEALGAKMGVLQRMYGNERARAVAEEYLRRFPGGSYSAAAQALTARP